MEAEFTAPDGTRMHFGSTLTIAMINLLAQTEQECRRLAFGATEEAPPGKVWGVVGSIGGGASYGWVDAPVEVDHSGVYNQNRGIGTNEVASNFNFFSHTFNFTTNRDGSLGHTYSWRNVGRIYGYWFMDEPNDMAAAKAALLNGNFLIRVGGPDLVPFIQPAFDMLRNSSHPNLWLAFNCKDESKNLIYFAISLRSGSN